MSKKDDNNIQEQIEKTGSVCTKNKKGNIYCLTIIGQIEGHDILPTIKDNKI